MKRGEEHYPAASVPEATPPTERVLLKLIEERGSEANLFFALGNVRLRKRRFADAIEAYEKALGLAPSLAQARSNLAFALREAGRSAEAEAQLKAVILQDPTLTYAQLQLGRLLLERGQREEARAVFEKLQRLCPEEIEAAVSLGRLRLEEGDLAGAKALLAEAFTRDSEYPHLKGLLGQAAFREGRLQFEAGNFEEAFATWGEAHRRYAPAFVTEQVIAQGMRGLIEEFLKSGGLVQALKEYEERYFGGERSPDLSYRLFSRFYFSVGLFPEAYESFSDLEGERARWRSSLQRKGEHPYPHFRFALLDTYEGKLEEAVAELRVCQDKFPRKKQDALRLPQILNFIGDVRALQQQKRAPRAMMSEGADWERLGFAVPFEAEAWKKYDFLPRQALPWRKAGFLPKIARDWLNSEFTPEEAARWLAAGMNEADTARSWRRAKTEPAVAVAWERESALSTADAVAWLRAGIENPSEARQWAEIFSLPGQARQWKEAGFSPHDAKRWQDEGISDPHEAKLRQGRV